MNHPFQAFGLMLALLIMAMLAVSSTPHLIKSAGGQPSSCEASQCTGGLTYSARQSLARRGRGGMFLVVIPAGDELTREEPAGDSTQDDAWRSHYDPIYDQIVYGYQPTTIERQQQLRTMALGLRNWVVRELQASSERLGWPMPLLANSAARLAPMEWGDYAALLDEIEESDSKRDWEARPVTGLPSLAGSPLSVPSKRWLLRFAASSLNQAGIALQAAASQLRELEEESIAREGTDFAR